MIIRVSFLVVASVAALVANSSRKPKTATKASGSDLSLQEAQNEENKGIDEFTHSESKVHKDREKEDDDDDDEKPEIHTSNNLKDFKENISETEEIRNLEKELERRKQVLEDKLLKLYGSREDRLCIAQLSGRLEAKAAEIDILNTTITSLRAEKTQFQEELKQNQLAEKKLEMAQKKIKEIEAKMQVSENEKMKEKLMKIEERVYGIQMKVEYNREEIADKKFKKVRDVEMELVEMKRRNKELQLEKRELTIRLESLWARMASLSHKVIEDEIPVEMEKEISSLRNTNEELLNQLERLQKNRFNMVEELVYQRWLNACLKFEIHKYQNPSRNSKCPTKKIKTSLTSNNPCLKSFSSSPASSADSKELVDSNFCSSSSSHTSISMKLNLLRKIGSWRRRNKKDESRNVYLSRKSLLRRFSTSIIRNDNGRQEIQDLSQAPRRRRVSFNDSVKTFSLAFQEETELSERECLQDKKMDYDFADDESPSSVLESTCEEIKELEGSTAPELGSNALRNDVVETRMASEVQIDHTETIKVQLELRKLIAMENESRIETSMSFGNVVFIFFLILLVLFLTFCK